MIHQAIYNLYPSVPQIRPALLKGIVERVSGNGKVLEKFKKDPTYSGIPTPLPI